MLTGGAMTDLAWMCIGLLTQVIIWVVAYHTVHFDFEDNKR